MDKQGYTVFELLAVIAILGLLFSIGVVSYNRIIRKSNETVYEAYRDGMHEAVITYVMEHPIANGTNEATITLSELIADKKIDYINNPKDKNDKCLGSYVTVKRNDIDGVVNYEYNVCLVCNDYAGEKREEKNCKWQYKETLTVLAAWQPCDPAPTNPSEGDTYCIKKENTIVYSNLECCSACHSVPDGSGGFIEECPCTHSYDRYNTIEECEEKIASGCSGTCDEQNITSNEVYEYKCETQQISGVCKTYSN